MKSPLALAFLSFFGNDRSPGFGFLGYLSDERKDSWLQESQSQGTFHYQKKDKKAKARGPFITNIKQKKTRNPKPGDFSSSILSDKTSKTKTQKEHNPN